MKKLLSPHGIFILIIWLVFWGTFFKPWLAEASEVRNLEFGTLLTEELSEAGKWSFPQKIFFTSYNPVTWQTDASPCIGANGTNVCEMYASGIRPIALSQDMMRVEYKYGERVRLYSDNPQCAGIFQIEDTLHERFTYRGDLFQPTRATNTSCFATITRL